MNAKVFGISVQDLKSKKGFAEQNGLNFRLLADDKREVSQSYGVLTGPGGVAKRYTFYVDPNGIVRKVDDKVQPFSAGKDVVANLKELIKTDPPLTSTVW